GGNPTDLRFDILDFRLTADRALARSNGFGVFGGLGWRFEISDSPPILHCGGNPTDLRFDILDFRLTADRALARSRGFGTFGGLGFRWCCVF
ncbi:hypothetical protein QUA81_23020, partial [Microcoleus sp. F6_B4]